MARLKNPDIEIVSIVDKAANLRRLIYKSAGSKPMNELTELFRSKVIKFDEEKGIAYAIVYAPNDVDAHGDWMTVEDVEKACYGFMRKSKTNAIDTNHNLEIAKGCFVVENWITKSGDALFPDDPIGSWAMGVKIENEETKKSIKDGELTGFSIYGTAQKLDEELQEKQFLQKVFDRIAKAFGEDDGGSVEIIKDFETIYSKMQLRTVADALCSAVWDVMYNDMLSLEEKQQSVMDVLDEAKAKFATIDLAKSEIVKAGKTISASNMKKLQAAMDAMQSLMDAANSETEKRLLLKNKNKTDMENVTKTEHDKVVKEKDDELKKVKDELEELKKKSNGSAQIPDDPEVIKIDGDKTVKPVVKFF